MANEKQHSSWLRVNVACPKAVGGVEICRRRKKSRNFIIAYGKSNPTAIAWPSVNMAWPRAVSGLGIYRRRKRIGIV
jgi:hypothetical protein